MWISGDGEILESLLGLIQIYSDKTAALLKYHALFAYSVYMVWFNLSGKQISYLIDHEHTLSNFHPVESRAIQIEEEEGGLEKTVSWYRFTSSKVVPLGTDVMHTSSSR